MTKKYTKPEDLQKWINGLSDEIMDDVNNLVKMYTIKIAQEASEQAPYDTGYLAGSIEYKLNTNRTKWEGTVFVGAEYGVHVEFGCAKTNHMAQPFLMPAYYKYSKEFYDDLIKAMEINLNG